ncbi:MAG: T9SS type A sorting domain-containing protein [Bacteroidetes bacterium]|nr:T9SS type A sorting domain-containing protein [Bacteroidota bacterium]
MLRNFILLSFFFSMFLSSYSQTFKFANTIDGISETYGINDTCVFKVDISGNSVWVKDFRGFIIPASTYRNELIGSAFDGKYLYVLEMQGRDYSFPHTYYPSIIKMDTLGNVIFTVSGSVFPGNSYTPYDIYPSYFNGAWVISEYAPGFTHYGDAFKIDSLGNYVQELGFWYGSVASIRKLTLLPDSTYLVCVNHRPSSPGGDEFTTLTKFDDNGNVIWRSDYKATGSGQFFELEMICDSAGNSYLFCYCSIPGIQGLAGMKISPTGNVLASKLWPSLMSVSNIRSISISNNEIVCTIDTVEIRFDTMLNSQCIVDQNLPVVTGNSYISSSHQYNYAPESFSPSNGLSITFSTSVSPDYCNLLKVQDDLLSAESVVIFPNPASDKINVQVSMKGSTVIRIFDIHSRKLLQREFSMHSEIDISNFSKGIYFAEITSGSGSQVKKIIID